MKMRENTRYQYLRSRKRCACCGKQDARTLEGFEHCVPCAEKARIRYNQDYKEINKQKRAENLAEGVCTRCGKYKPSAGYRICDKCRQYAADAYRKKCLRQMQTKAGETVGAE
jgi:hypothetical protein